MNWTALQKSLPSRGAWIEIIRQRLLIVAQVSLPSRGAWIEIRTDGLGQIRLGLVAPLTGSVD